MRDINTYYDAHKDEGFVVIGINLEEDARAIKKFTTATPLSFPVVMDSKGKVADQYGVQGLPTSFFVSRTGEIIGYWSGELTLEMLEMGVPPLMEK
jgi:peroxiredoxin